MKKWINNHPWMTFWLAVLALNTLVLIFGCASHHGTLPDPSDDWPLPEVCVVLPLVIDDGEMIIKLPLLWFDFYPKDKLIIGSCWNDCDPNKPGFQKLIIVWQYSEPGGSVEMLWYDIFDDPYPYLSYPNFAEQGPVCAGNFRGGDNGRCEIIYRRYDDTDGTFNLVLVDGLTGETITKRTLEAQPEWSAGLQDVLAGNFTQARNRILSDIICVYRYYGKTARKIECYKASSLVLNWRYTIEAEGRYNELWACHRPEVMPWSNGRDVLWFGNGILDWNGKGIFDFEGVQPYPAELHGVGGTEPITTEHLDHHWDSICWWEGERGPSFIATTDSKRCWYFPGPEKRCYDGRCYVEWEATRFVGGEDEWGFNTTHIHRLRTLSDNRFLCTDLPPEHHGTGGYRALICDKNFRIIAEIPTQQEVRDIEFNGLHDKKEILTDGIKGGVYDINGKLIRNRKGKGNLESIFVCDLWGTGHEQYFDARRRPDKVWELVAYSNPSALRNKPVPIDGDNDFY